LPYWSIGSDEKDLEDPIPQPVKTAATTSLLASGVLPDAATPVYALREAGVAKAIKSQVSGSRQWLGEDLFGKKASFPSSIVPNSPKETREPDTATNRWVKEHSVQE
jgi:hypothetical protein